MDYLSKKFFYILLFSGLIISLVIHALVKFDLFPLNKGIELSLLGSYLVFLFLFSFIIMNNLTIKNVKNKLKTKYFNGKIPADDPIIKPILFWHKVVLILFILSVLYLAFNVIQIGFSLALLHIFFGMDNIHQFFKYLILWISLDLLILIGLRILLGETWYEAFMERYGHLRP